MSEDPWTRFDPAYGRRVEFAELARHAGRDANRRSSIRVQGAENLLKKAVRAIGAGDEDMAQRLIGRAAAMPWDEHEEGSPGIRGGCMLVYRAVVDRFEDSGRDDSLWLDVALEVLAGAEAWGRADLASVLHGIVIQTAFFDPTREEIRRIREAAGSAPLDADLGDGPDATVEHRSEVIESICRVVLSLEQGYDAAGW